MILYKQRDRILSTFQLHCIEKKRKSKEEIIRKRGKKSGEARKRKHVVYTTDVYVVDNVGSWKKRMVPGDRRSRLEDADGKTRRGERKRGHMSPINRPYQ